jgi:hypothetical protein
MTERISQFGIAFLVVAMLVAAVTALSAVTTESTVRGGGDLWSGPDKASAVEAPNWIETFDTYRTGTQLHGVGGWKGWNNNPVAGAFTSNTQAHSALNSVDVVGVTDLVHEYLGYDSGSWTYIAWQFIPSGTTGTPYFIMLNQYDDLGGNDNWSVQVQFDPTIGTVINTGLSVSNPVFLRRDQWVEIRVVIDLDSDTQTFYYDGQELYTGTWSNQVSGGGIAAIAAVSLAAIGSSSVFYDDISLTTNLLFGDGFESGDTLAWTTTVP